MIKIIWGILSSASRGGNSVVFFKFITSKLVFKRNIFSNTEIKCLKKKQ
jgi:hypothetical protein